MKFFFKCLLLIISIQTAVCLVLDGSTTSLQFSTDYILPFLVVICFVPFYEECIYRGCLIDVFHHFFKYGLVLPIVLSSVIFSGMHVQHSGILYYVVLFFISLILSFARVKSGGLLPSMLLHSLMNTFVLVLNTLLK